MNLPLFLWAVAVALIGLLLAKIIPSPTTPWHSPHRELDWEGMVLPMAKAYAAARAVAAQQQFPEENYDDGDDDDDDDLSLLEQQSSDNPARPLQGVTVVITGATSGIGKSLARAMIHPLGADTVIAMGRSTSKLQALQRELEELSLSSSSRSRLVPIQADFNDLRTVAAAAREILQQYPCIDILVNNAGAHDGVSNFLGTKQSAQGYDAIFAVNYLSHFLLTEMLAPALAESQAPIVLQVSSSYHYGVDGSDLIPTLTKITTTTAPTTTTTQSKDDAQGGASSSSPHVNREHGPPVASQVGGSHGFFMFRSSRSYSNSKLAQIWHARALKRHHPLLQSHDKFRAVSACPGWVRTNIVPEKTLLADILHWGGFRSDGWGLSSLLLALFDDNDDDDDDNAANKNNNTQTSNNQTIPGQTRFLPPRDYYVNSALWNPFFSTVYDYLPKWAYKTGIRDVLTFLVAMSLLFLQRQYPESSVSVSSPESYQIESAMALYEWSLSAVQEYL